MSDDEQDVVRTEIATRMLTAEYKDGQLEIVEMTPYQKGHKMEGVAHVIAEGSESSNEGLKYMQVLDADKNVVVDLLNLTLVRCEDGQEAYRIVSNDTESGDDTTVTCVLSNEDSEEQDNQESYVVLEGEQGPMVFLQSSLPQTNQTVKVEQKEQKPKMSPTEILERAKALQKAKALMSAQSTKGRSRKRKNELPPPHELLASPQFKLFLYSCKLCTFKCNAIKELTAHKAEEHNGTTVRWRGGGRAAASSLQCARCPYRATTHTQLMKHVKEKHLDGVTKTESRGARVLLESAEVREADVLVCGACGFESAARDAFRRHIEREHGVTPC